MNVTQYLENQTVVFLRDSEEVGSLVEVWRRYGYQGELPAEMLEVEDWIKRGACLFHEDDGFQFFTLSELETFLNKEPFLSGSNLIPIMDIMDGNLLLFHQGQENPFVYFDKLASEIYIEFPTLSDSLKGLWYND